MKLGEDVKVISCLRILLWRSGKTKAKKDKMKSKKKGKAVFPPFHKNLRSDDEQVKLQLE